MPSTISPTERIFNLAAFLKQCGAEGTTLDDITRHVPGYAHDAGRDETGRLVGGTAEWETLRKGLQRDLEDLRTAWDIDADYDDEHRVYRLRAPFFSPKERAALIAAAATVDVEGIDGRPGQLGAGVSDVAADVVIRVHQLVADLREAIDTRSPVAFTHEGRRRTLQPYALGTWRGRWYVAGWDPDLDTMRRYRLERIEPTAELERVTGMHAYEVPEWFNPELAFEFDPNSWGRDPRLRARVAVDRDYVAPVLEEFGARPDGSTDARPDAQDVVVFDVRHYESTRNRLLAFRDHVRVVGPPVLVQMMREHLEAIAAPSAPSAPVDGTRP